MRNRLEMVLGWSDFSFLIIGSLDEKESENRKCPKLVENHPINQFWHEKSIGNDFRIITLLFLDHRSPWWKRIKKSKMVQIGRQSSYKPILIWEIDWKWFQDDSTNLSRSSVPLMKKSQKMVYLNWKRTLNGIAKWNLLSLTQRISRATPGTSC